MRNNKKLTKSGKGLVNVTFTLLLLDVNGSISNTLCLGSRSDIGLGRVNEKCHNLLYAIFSLQASSSFVSGVSGPLLGIFVLAAFFPFANWIVSTTI